MAELEGPVRELVNANPHRPAWRAALMTLLWETGRRDEALRELDALATHDFADIPRDGDWLIAITLLAEGAAELGDRRALAAALRAAAPVRRRQRRDRARRGVSGRRPRGILGRLAATVGDRAEAARALRARAGGQRDAQDPAATWPTRSSTTPSRWARGEASAKLIEAAARTARGARAAEGRASRRGGPGHVAVRCGPCAMALPSPALMCTRRS